MDKKNNNKVFFGIALITTAILMFLSVFNLLPPGLFSQTISYTLIIYGFYALLKRSFYTSVFAMAFALKLSPEILQTYLNFKQIGWFTLFFISFLLATGLEILFAKNYRWKKKYKEGSFVGYEFSNRDKSDESDLFGEYVKAKVSMGESSRYIKTDHLKEAYLACTLGSLTAYFIGSEMKQDINVHLDCQLGNTTLYFPSGWKVVNNLNVSLGDASIYESENNSEFTVFLNGNVSLANVDIYFN